MVWDHENRLYQSKIGSTVEESYLYDDSGQRIKKWNSTSAVYYPNAFYEVETGNGSVVASQVEDFAPEAAPSDAVALDANPIYLPLVAQSGTVAGLQSGAEGVSAASLATNVVKYYYFGGQRVAMKDGSNWYYLHNDHLGGTAFVTKTDGTKYKFQAYNAYGSKRLSQESLPTDRQYTGQQKDKTGLYYYNARYYDPGLGQFVSPDTIVPDPSKVFDYNRYMYVRGNAINFNDPTGHNTAVFDPGYGGLGAGLLLGVALMTYAQLQAEMPSGRPSIQSEVSRQPTVLSDPQVGQPANRTTLVPQDDGSYTGGFMTTDLPGIQTTGDSDSAGVGELMGKNVYDAKPLTRDEHHHIGRINSIPGFLNNHPDLATEARIINNGGTLPSGRNHVQEAEQQVSMLNKAIGHLKGVYRNRNAEAQQQIDDALNQAGQHLDQLNGLLNTR